MKKRLFLLGLICSILIVLPACGIDMNGSVKALTSPYIAEYECVEARLGEKNFLEKYDFIKITLLDKEQLEVSFKPKNGEKRVFRGAYSVDEKTRELSGEIGILGFKHKEKVTVKNGEFLIKKNIGSRPLIMKFSIK